MDFQNSWRAPFISRAESDLICGAIYPAGNGDLILLKRGSHKVQDTLIAEGLWNLQEKSVKTTKQLDGFPGLLTAPVPSHTHTSLHPLLCFDSGNLVLTTASTRESSSVDNRWRMSRVSSSVARLHDTAPQEFDQQ